MYCGRVSNQLSAYIDRELTGTEMLQIRTHLASCDRCRAEHEDLSRMKGMLGRLRTPEPPHDLVSRTVQRFEAAGMWASSARVAASPISNPAYRTECPYSGVPVGASLIQDRLARLQVGACRLLGLVPWKPLSLGLTAAVLALALVFTNVLRYRQADATVAFTPPRVRQGQDPMGTDWPPGDFSLQSTGRDQSLGSNSSLRWVNVSLEGEASWPSR